METLRPEEKTNLASNFAGTFIQRWDLKAFQLKDGSYVCVRQPLNLDDILNHLKGNLTLGSYLLDRNSMAKYVVLDADNEAEYKSLVGASMILSVKNIPSYVEDSRRGGHLWLFFDPIDGNTAKDFGTAIKEKYDIDCEVFPKQGKVGDGPGSLIRLPFGVHQKTSQRYGFVKQNEPLAPTLFEQFKILSNPEKVSLDDIKRYLPEKQNNPPLKRLSENPEIKSIKDKINLYDFVTKFVELRPSGSGYVGKCPFHDDQHYSFGIKGNYWQCFAGCGSGNIILFWMKLKQVDYPVAIKELTKIIGHKSK